MTRVRPAVVSTAAALAIVIAPVLAADIVTLKLATVAPKSSSFVTALSGMDAAWHKATGGRVKLRLFTDGSVGDEPTAISLMQPPANHLHAALLTLPGLTRIDEAFSVFGIPFFFQSDEELAYVHQKLAPQLTKRLEAKGFHLVAWSSAGWVQVFSRKPVRTLDQLKQTRLFTSQGSDAMVQWYKANGFHPVALSANDMPGGLATGIVDAVPIPPYPAAVLSVFRYAKFMLDLRVAPLIGATVITTAAWNRVSSEDRAAMMPAARVMEQEMLASAPRQDATAITEMRTRGLTVTTLGPAAAAEFRAEAEKLKTSMRGTMVPIDIYDLALAERDTFRKSKGH